MVTRPRQIELLATKSGEKPTIFIATERNVKDVRSQLGREGWRIHSSKYAQSKRETEAKFKKEIGRAVFGKPKVKDTANYTPVPASFEREEVIQEAIKTKRFEEGIKDTKPVQTIKREQGYGQEIVVKEPPKVTEQPQVTMIPEKQQVITEVEVPGRETKVMGGVQPDALRIQEPRSTYQAKRQANILTATTVGSTFATPVVAGIAGISPEVSSAVKSVSKVTTATSLGLAGIKIATTPKEERKYVTGDIVAGLAGTTIGGLAGQDLITVKPIKTENVNPKLFRQIEEKTSYGIRQRQELVLEPTKKTVSGQTPKDIGFDYRETRGFVGEATVEVGTGKLVKENIKIQTPSGQEYGLRGQPKVPFQEIKITGSGGGTLKGDPDDFLLTEYIFDKPFTIKKSDVPDFMPSTKQIGKIKPFQDLGIAKTPSITPIPFINPKIDVKEVVNVFKPKTEIRGKNPMTGMVTGVKPMRRVPLIEDDFVYISPAVRVSQPVVKPQTKQSVVQVGVRELKNQNKIAITSLPIKELSTQTTQKQKPIQVPIMQNIQIPTQRPIQKQPQIQTPIQTPTIIPKIRTPEVPIFKDPYIPKTTRPSLPGIKMPRLPKRKPKPVSYRMAKGFDVEVRKAGKWFKTTAQPLLEGEALKFGARIVETTPRATFRIVPSKKAPVATRIPFAFKPERFRAPKRKGTKSTVGGIFIEKSKLRIDTPGELKGITFAKRKKRRRKK